MVATSVRSGPQPSAEEGQASPFRVGQTHASSAQLRLQHEVLGSEVLDHLLLLARDPADERREHQMRRNHPRESIRSMPDDDFGQ